MPSARHAFDMSTSGRPQIYLHDNTFSSYCDQAEFIYCYVTIRMVTGFTVLPPAVMPDVTRLHAAPFADYGESASCSKTSPL